MHAEKKKEKEKKELKMGILVIVTCRAREMRIDDFFCVRIEVDKHPEDELARCYCILLRTYNKLRKITVRLEVYI